MNLENGLNTLRINGMETITVPKYFVPGLGFSPASGPPTGGVWLGDSGDAAVNNAGSFFQYDVKGLFPNNFGKSVKKSTKKTHRKRKTRRTKKTKKAVSRKSRSKKSVKKGKK